MHHAVRVFCRHALPGDGRVCSNTLACGAPEAKTLLVICKSVKIDVCQRTSAESRPGPDLNPTWLQQDF